MGQNCQESSRKIKMETEIMFPTLLAIYTMVGQL